MSSADHNDENRTSDECVKTKVRLIYIGVDVGTASVRAAFFTDKGEYLIGTSRQITVNNPAPDFYQQSSDEIWTAVCCCISELATNISNNNHRKWKIGGIGFAATCSLVVLDSNHRGLRYF